MFFAPTFIFYASRKELLLKLLSLLNSIQKMIVFLKIRIFDRKKRYFISNQKSRFFYNINEQTKLYQERKIGERIYFSEEDKIWKIIYLQKIKLLSDIKLA